MAPRLRTSFELSESLVRKIDASCGALTREEFVSLCISNLVQEEKVPVEREHYITREEFERYERRLADILLSFLEMLPSWEIDAWNKRKEYEKLKQQLLIQLD